MGIYRNVCSDLLTSKGESNWVLAIHRRFVVKIRQRVRLCCL